MNDSRRNQYEMLDEMHRLVAASMTGKLTDAERTKLNELVVRDADTCDLYLDVIYESGILLTWAAHGVTSQELPNAEPRQSGVDCGTADMPAPASAPFPVAIHNTFNYLTSGWPLAYLIATVICGVGLTIAAFTYVSQPADIAQHSSNSAPQSPIPNPSPKATIVARITGTVDCRWGRKGGVASGQWLVDREETEERGEGRGKVQGSRFKVQNRKIAKFTNSNPQSLIPNPSLTTNHYPLTTHPKSLVRLGDQFILSAGLMEITYNTGAKVILQGPCTFEVDSANGGFLTVGKLTARVEKSTKYGVRSTEQVASESSLTTNHYPLSTNSSPLFAVRTPAATITDLGTEFGVEVTESGQCEVHVMEGVVKAEFLAPEGQPPQSIHLTQGEACHYRPESGVAEKIAANREKFHAMKMARSDDLSARWRAYSQSLRNDPALVAYYPFDSVGNDGWLLKNASGAGANLDGQIEGPLWSAGRFADKVSLRFRGPGAGNKVVLPDQKRFQFTGPFSVAVWFKVDRFTAKYQPLVTKGDYSWRLQQDADKNVLAFDTNPSEGGTLGLAHTLSGQTDVADGRWHLAVAVYEPAENSGIKRLYVDGRLEAEGRSPGPLNLDDQPVWLGANSMVSRQAVQAFEGLIDEVAIFARALSPDEIAAMHQAGNPTSTSSEKQNPK